jgi:hypothetical protein
VKTRSGQSDPGPGVGAGPASKMELLPGFEPGSLDSKSRVITITLQKLLDTQKVVIVGLEPTTLGLLDPCSTI